MFSVVRYHITCQFIRTDRKRKLIDENSQPLPYANVVLLSLPDSAFVSGTISGEDGSFTLEATSENQIVRNHQ